MKQAAFAVLNVALSSAATSTPGGFAHAPVVAADFDQRCREHLAQDGAADLHAQGDDCGART